MWINVEMHKPLKRGFYKTLQDLEGFGNLTESEEDFFNGEDWDIYYSNFLFIRFWWADEEDSKIILKKAQEGRDSTQPYNFFNFEELDYMTLHKLNEAHREKEREKDNRRTRFI